MLHTPGARALSVGLLAGAVATAAFVAAALAQTPAATKVVEDPQGRFSIETPRNWPVDNETSASGRTAILAGVDPECQFHAIPEPASASLSAAAVARSWAAPLSASKWQESVTPFKGVMFDSAPGAMSVSDASVDTSGYFPIQKATVTLGEKTARFAILPRPGLVVWSFCRSWKPGDNTALFDTVQRTFKTPQDAAAIEAAASAATAPAAPAPAAPAPAAPKK